MALAALLASCGSGGPPAPPDPGPFPPAEVDPPHAVEATVVGAAHVCSETGDAGNGFMDYLPGQASPGVVCRLQVPLPAGEHIAAVRLATGAVPGPGAPGVHLEVRDATGQPLSVPGTEAAPAAAGYGTLEVHAFVPEYEEVTVEVAWAGDRPVRIEHLEVAPDLPGVAMDPPSTVLAGDAPIVLQITDTWPKPEIGLDCNGRDLRPRLTRLKGTGEASEITLGSRRQLRVSARALLDGCPDRASVTARLLEEPWASPVVTRTAYLRSPPACAPAGDRTRLLLTAFEPFPADNPRDNSSRRAIELFDDASFPDLAVTRLVLPVEWQSAADLLEDVVDRCHPDVVLALGQGPADVFEIEARAFNARQWPDLADNRGVRWDGGPALPGGPDALASGMPVDRVVRALGRLAVNARVIDEPRPFVCNDVFYRLLLRTAGSGVVAGFVHVPALGSAGDVGPARLGRAVETIVREMLSEEPPGRLTRSAGPPAPVPPA